MAIDLCGSELRNYRRYRGKGIPARYALQTARQDFKVSEWEWDTYGDTATCERDGWTLTLEPMPDDHTDFEWLGTFTDNEEDGAISNADSDTHHSFKWFVPSYSFEERRKDNHRAGMSRAVAYKTARAQCIADMELAREYQEYFVKVTASRNDIELGSAGIGGFSIDESRMASVQFEALADEELAAMAIEDAQEQLAKLKATA